jgi:hypothetical protein
VTRRELFRAGLSLGAFLAVAWILLELLALGVRST